MNDPRASAQRLSLVLLLSTMTTAALGCGSDDDPAVSNGDASSDGRGPDAGSSVRADGSACTWGNVAACTCSTGAAGAQRCLSDNTFGPCVCGERADAASGGDGPVSVDSAKSDGSTPPPPPDAAGVDLAVDRSPDLPPDSPPAGFVLTRSAAVPARHLLADPVRKLLYATVGGTAAANANSLVVIDPADLSIRHAVALGSDPGSLAMSDDGTTLWVGIDGAFAVRKIDLTTTPPTAGTQYILPKGQFGDTAAAGPMAVLPGSKTSLAVSLHRSDVSPSFAGLSVLDDGVARAVQTPGHTGASRVVVGPPGWLFGFNNLHTGFGFYAITVAATGVTQTEHPGLVDGFSTDIVYASNRVYATSGEVVDVSAPAKPVRAGKFGFAGLVLPRPPHARVLMISGGDSFSSSNATLRVLDATAFTQLSSTTISGLARDRLWDAVDLGDDTVAFLSSPDQFSGAGTAKVHVLQSPAVRTAP